MDRKILEPIQTKAWECPYCHKLFHKRQDCLDHIQEEHMATGIAYYKISQTELGNIKVTLTGDRREEITK